MADLSLARKTIDARLARLRPAGDLQPPPRGWVRAIRDALGMTTAQMARRAGVSQPNIVRLEQAEARRTVTLASLDKAARALDCTLVYALVPNTALTSMVQAQATRLAENHLRSAGHSMRLEDQGVGSANEAALARDLVASLLRGKPSRLWDEPGAEG